MEIVNTNMELTDAQPLKRKQAQPVEDPTFTQPLSEVKTATTKALQVPPEYVEISLSSCGKLGFPAKVHVRDYLASDVLKLASITDDNIVEVLLGVLDNMIYEDVDIYKLHEKDMEEILINIHLKFWGAVIEKYPFEAIVEDFEKMSVYQKAQMDAGKDPFVTDINLTQLKTTPISEKYKDPFRILNPEQGIKVGFTLPRIGNAAIIKKFCENKFNQYEEKFSVVKMMLRQQEEGDKVTIDPKLYQEYANFIRERDEYYLMLSQAMLIEEFDGKKLETMEEKIEAYKKVSLQTWVKYNQVQEEIGVFGINSEVEVPSPAEEGQTVKRNFRFQLVDLIPAYRLPDTNGFVVEF